MNFEYRENIDGSFELFNTDIGDIYFSNIGAYNEAMQKFVLPSNVDCNKKNIRLLDACYGMGYNSKAFVNYLLKQNNNITIEIDAIDIDKKILAFSLFLMDKNINDDIHLLFGHNLLNQINLDKNIDEILGENWINSFFSILQKKFREKIANKRVYLYKAKQKIALLHNIYYQNHANDNKNLKIKFFSDNLPTFLSNNYKKYDFIFHDAFSILKQPELWSKEIMQNYHRLLNIGGKFLTYSNSRQLRRILAECGFEVFINSIGDRKQNGTIAIKNC